MRKIFEQLAIDHYTEQAKASSADAYMAYRAIEFSRSARDQPFHQSCLKNLIRRDPYFVLASLGVDLSSLKEADARELENCLVFDDPDAGNYAKGKLLHAVGYYRERREAPVLERALGYLTLVPEARRDSDYFRMIVDCLHVVDPTKAAIYYAAYLDSVEPKWQAHSLVDILRAAIDRDDFETYKAFRDRFLALPVNSHTCQCYFNKFYNWEGLLALREDRVDDIPTCLERAKAVHACPHLNSYGFYPALAKTLIQRKLHLPLVRAYLDVGDKFAESKDAPSLRAALLAAEQSS